MKFEIYPEFKDFKEISEKVNVIPLYTYFLSDFETPVSSFLKIAKGSYNFLLESAEQEEKIGRYSFIGSYPEIIIKAKNGKVEIIDYNKGEKKEIKMIPALKVIEEMLENYNTLKIKNLPSFTGGFVGFISYDYIRQIEKIPDFTEDKLLFPDFIFFFPKKFIIFDHFKRRIFLITNILLTGINHKGDYENGLELLLNFINESQNPLKLVEGKNEEKGDEFRSNFKKEEFIESVKKVKKYIFEGDIIQAVISQRWEKEIDVEPFKIYRALRSLNPSPYMFFLELGELKLIGSSPEILVKFENGMHV
jgi:Anthranilate/para-aminobenzoate synthases component I